MKIGFFDSGKGGSYILDAVQAAMPEHEYLTYFDTKNAPYGNRAEEEIYQLTKTGIETLFAQGAKLIIIACNTASVETTRRLQTEYLPVHYPERRILGMVIPTIEALIEHASKKTLLIGTTRTVNSHKYERELEKRNISSEILIPHATPQLVPLIEAEKISEALYETIKVIDSHKGIDTVILGCTHYTILASALRTYYGEKIHIISQETITTDKLRDYLNRHPELATAA